MNARTRVFEFQIEARQVEEVIACIFHNVFFHRVLGKCNYTGEHQFSVEAVGFTDVDCESVDYSYTRTTSDALNRNLNRNIADFCELLRSNEHNSNAGQISLEFFQKKKPRWSFHTSIPWEVWTIKIEIIKIDNEIDRQKCRESLSEMLADKVNFITEVMNREEFVPKTPSLAELGCVFDNSYPNVQPYLFKIDYSIAGNANSGNQKSIVGNTFQKLMQSFT